MLRWLREVLRFGITANQGVVTGHRTPLGYQQLTVTTAVFLTMPTTTVATVPGGWTVQQVPGYAIIQCNGGNVRWRDDGTAPTAAIGMTIVAGAELDYVGDISRLQFILSSGTPIIDVSLYA